MRRNIATIVIIVVALGVLILLNVLFISEPRREESEESGDRSSYKGTPYGTLAYFDLLNESGHTAVRYENPFTELHESGLGTLFVIDPNGENQPTEAEMTSLGEWVTSGGRLVVVDRYISIQLSDVTFKSGGAAGSDVKPVAVSPLTRGADSLKMTAFANTVEDASRVASTEFASPSGSVVIERSLGEGQVILIGDPYVLQNNGLREGGNLALALNLAEADPQKGRIGFDEYHHGYGGNRSASAAGLRGYIAGTPVPWIILQLGILSVVIAATVGVRLGRPVPRPVDRRTSALEFVSSMANIQRLAEASDLAVDNIASGFKSRLCRVLGLPSNAPAKVLANAAATRANIDPTRLEDLLRRCDQALVGNRLSPSDLLALVTELRTIEAELKLPNRI